MIWHSVTPAPGLAPASFVRAVAATIAGVWKALVHRREVLSLAELDERALKDIGLSRSDVDGALAEPLHRDPTLVLVRVHEHRREVQALAAPVPPHIVRSAGPRRPTPRLG